MSRSAGSELHALAGGRRYLARVPARSELTTGRSCGAPARRLPCHSFGIGLRQTLGESRGVGAGVSVGRALCHEGVTHALSTALPLLVWGSHDVGADPGDECFPNRNRRAATPTGIEATSAVVIGQERPSGRSSSSSPLAESGANEAACTISRLHKHPACPPSSDGCPEPS
jgi:hypothetical protein